MNNNEMPQLLTTKIKNFFTNARQAVSENINYLKSTPSKQLAKDALRFAYKAAKFILNVAFRSFALLVAVFLFMQAISLLASGFIVPAIVAAAIATLALRLSGPPYRIAKFVVSTIAYPVIYIAKTIGLGIVDFLLHEFGLVQQIQNKRKGQLLQLSNQIDDEGDVDIDENNQSKSLDDLNPSIDATVSADLFSFHLGPFKITPGVLFRYVLDPFDLKNQLKKTINYMFYLSGLEDRARFLLSKTPESIAKKLLIKETSDIAEQNLIDTVNSQLLVADIAAQPCSNLSNALRLIAENDVLAQIKFADNKNWFHLLNQINLTERIVNEQDANSYQTICNKLIQASISPYDRDDQGKTAFKGSVNPKLDVELRKAIHGGVPIKSIGLKEQYDRLCDFLENAKDIQDDTALDSDRFLLLEGQPGVGKTEMVNAAAKERGYIVINFANGTSEDKYVGQKEKRIRQSIKKARDENRPVVFFVDEIDSLAHKNEFNSTHGGHEASVIATFQKLIPNALRNTKVVCIAATNYPERLKEAVLNRAGVTVKVGTPSYQIRKSILEDLFIQCSFTDSEMILERLAHMYDGKVPRDLESFSKEVIKHAKHRHTSSQAAIDKELRVPFKGELLLEDFEAVHKDFIKGSSGYFEVIYPTIKVPENKCDEFEIPYLDPKVIAELEKVNDFFDSRFPTICGNSPVKLHSVLLTGFLAADFKRTMANHNTKGATIYIDAASLPEKFSEELTQTLSSIRKATVIIDNIDKLDNTKSVKLQQLLAEISGTGRSLYIIGATEKTAATKKIWPDFFKRNIVKAERVTDKTLLAQMIESILDLTRKRGISVSPNMMREVTSGFLATINSVDISIHDLIRNANEIILKMANARNFKENDVLLFTNMQPHLDKFKETASQAAKQDQRERSYKRAKHSHT